MAMFDPTIFDPEIFDVGLGFPGETHGGGSASEPDQMGVVRQKKSPALIARNNRLLSFYVIVQRINRKRRNKKWDLPDGAT